MTRLSKANVEALLATYDAEPITALTAALRVALDAPSLEWAQLLQLADFPADRRRRLRAGHPDALDRLAADLNELREVARLTS